MHQNLNAKPFENRTNVNEVKQLNATSGLTYNEVKQMLVQKIRNPDEEELIDKTHHL
ncbi:hypothetical protein [Paenisporosarcina quisquiliarum]|uniref:hypothetical protein n=1 Tax=Paenisporosarcina quisquiliarum TaxID=365346 RepID=UPI00373709F3